MSWQSNWSSNPSEAYWYGCVIIERPGEVSSYTDYVDAYSASTEPPNVDELCPYDSRILERELRATPLGKDMLDGWADDEILPNE